MMDIFGISWRDEESGLYYEALYFVSGTRFYVKYRVGGQEKKAKRISAADYISAWESYKNY